MNTRPVKTTILLISVAVILAVIAFAVVREKREHTAAGESQSRAAVTLLPPPTATGVGVSKERVSHTSATLDRIAGASFDEVASLLRSLNGTEIRVLANQLRTLSPGSLSSQKIQMFFAGWAKLDPSSAFSTALAFENSWVKEQALRAVFDGMNPTAAAAMVQTLSQLPENAIPDGFRQQLLGEAIVKWSFVDAEAAARALSSIGREAPGSTWIKVADHWAATDPKSALEWANSQQGEGARLALQGLMSGWSQKDPAAAADYAKSHSETLAGQQATGLLASRLASRSATSAAEWASSLPNVDARSMAELTVGVAWAQTDPEGAAQWAANLPPADRDNALTAVISTWAQNDPQKSAEWLNSLDPANRDSVVAAYSSAVTRIDPPAALSWAFSIDDPKIRNEVSQRVTLDWMTRDSAAARNWINSSALPEQDKARLLNTPGSGP